MLVDVHANSDIFRIEKLPENQPLVFALGDKLKTPDMPCVSSHKEFMRNFNLFTEYQLRELDWSNVFVAGGTTLACLQPIPAPHNKDNISIRNYYHKLAYKVSVHHCLYPFFSLFTKLPRVQMSIYLCTV